MPTVGDADRTLVEVSVRPTLAGYMAELWRARHFALTLALNDHRSENRSLLLGDLWHLLNPALQIAVYAFVFGVMLSSTRPRELVAFITVGVLLFGFLQRGITDGSMALIQDRSLVLEVAFPRAALPLASLLQAALELRWQLVVMLAVLGGTTGGPRPGWIGFALIVLPAAFVLSFGLALAWARLTALVRDLSGVLQVGFRVLLFASGVMFPLAEVLGPERSVMVELINPFAGTLALARHFLIEPVPHVGPLLASVLIWSAVALLAGLRLFLHAEQDYGNR